ncbi:MAG: secretin N-terminal domain-containing protein, partial [Planctomycetaceae bacterium]
AREDQHEAIKALLDQMQADAKAMPKKELATFNIEGLDAKAVTKTLTPLVDEDAEITADPTGRRLFVRALPEKREQIEKLVQSVINSLPSRKGVQTKAYRTLVGDADEVKEAIAVLFPDAVVGFDSERKVVVATALPEEHEAIQKVVDQLVADGGETRVSAKTYPLRNADGVALARSLALMYRRTEAQISYDAGTKTLLAVARQDQHEAIAKLVEQLEGADAPEDNRTVEFYSLEGADGLAVRNVVQDLLDQIDPKSSVVNDEGSQQLVVTTIAAGHVKVKDAIARLQQQKLQREIEVFALNRLEPFSAELAVNSLFDDGNTKLRDLPLLQSDNDSQQLIVRGTAEQIEQIRDLLIKMGETGLRKTNPNAKVRVIPVTGDTVEALKGLEKVWPKIRRNPIKVLQPGSRVREIVPGKPVLPKLPSGRGKNQAALRKDAAGTRGLVHYTAFRSKQQDDQLAPVLVVPGNGRITISSDDTEALNQMEALLQAVFSSSGSRRRKDFNVYALTNAAATTVSDLLNNIFKRDDSPIMFGNVVVIPDQRLNALIVFAGRTDRERIEQLIEILDSDNIPETVATARTNVVPIEHADAAKINTVLTGIYKAQMSTGGSRSQVSIPKGVPSSVATVLRQINAASSAPLLNVQVEETTNSLVIMAPQNLMEEVTELVQRLDQAASTSRARGVSIIELQKTNSRRVMDVLNRVLKD